MNHPRPLIVATLAAPLVAGCGASVQHLATPLVPGFATTLYVNNYDSDGLNQISAYSVIQNNTPLTTNQTSIPSLIATLTLPSGVYAGLMATDGAGDLYIATSTDIREYAAGATGLATPVRVIPMTTTTTLTACSSGSGYCANIEGLAVDASGNIYVSEYGAGVAVFNSTANGNVAPSRYILGDLQPGGGLSTIQQPGLLAVDATGNLYVGSSQAGGFGSILTFAAGANGNIAPVRSLSAFPDVFAVDASGNIYVRDGGSPIAVFAAGANGSVAPVRTIDWLNDVVGLAADSLGNLFVSDGTAYPPTDSCLGLPGIYQFAPNESGSESTAMPTAIYPGGPPYGCVGPGIAIH